MSHKRDILVVDDNAATVMLIVEVLNEAGYCVRGVADGASALAAIAARRPALLLIDMRMPDMSGADVAAQLREPPFADIPIVLMTASPNRAVPPMPAGVVARLDKPFDLDVLVACIAQYAN